MRAVARTLQVQRKRCSRVKVTFGSIVMVIDVAEGSPPLAGLNYDALTKAKLAGYPCTSFNKEGPDSFTGPPGVAVKEAVRTARLRCSSKGQKKGALHGDGPQG